MSDPYRTVHARFSPVVVEQMVCAVSLLKEWQEHDPVLAGGALWSWAADQQAHDLDIFMEDTRASRRWADTLGAEYENPATELARHDYYGQLRHNTPASRKAIAKRKRSNVFGWFYLDRVHAYRTKVSRNVLVDVVLSPWQSCEATHHFDYAHLRNAFGARTIEMHGAYFYARGWLVEQPEAWNVRGWETVRRKVEQTGLWKKPEAFMRLADVMQELAQLYHRDHVAEDFLRALKERDG